MSPYFSDINNSNYEYLFISDIHGRSKKLEEELLLIARETNPNIVFFLGDIVGTDKLAKLQQLFYNRVFNHIKNIDLEELSDQQVLAIQIDNKENTIADGCLEIINFLQQLKSSYQRKSKANFVREMRRYSHFGHFISCLPKTIKEILKKDLEKNAAAIINIMTQFTNKGSKVIVVEGNWDARTPLDFYPDKRLCKPLPVKDRDFYFKDFLQSLNKKVIYFNQPGIIEEKNKIFVLWPFDAAINGTLFPQLNLKQQEKTTILVSHAQIKWEPVKGDISKTDENEKIEENMDDILINSDIVVHGHLHDSLNGWSGYISQRRKVYYLPFQKYRFIDF